VQGKGLSALNQQTTSTLPIIHHSLAHRGYPLKLRLSALYHQHQHPHPYPSPHAATAANRSRFILPSNLPRPQVTTYKNRRREGACQNNIMGGPARAFSNHVLFTAPPSTEPFDNPSLFDSRFGITYPTLSRTRQGSWQGRRKEDLQSYFPVLVAYNI
jgi:hypothetical protein